MLPYYLDSFGTYIILFIKNVDSFLKTCFFQKTKILWMKVENLSEY
jgi:hypothetical protein